MSVKRATRTGLILCAVGVLGLLLTRVAAVAWVGRVAYGAPAARQPRFTAPLRPGRGAGL